MVILLILVTGYCYQKHLESRNWLEEQREFYFTRTWWWEHHPEEFEDDRIHFKH